MNLTNHLAGKGHGRGLFLPLVAVVVVLAAFATPAPATPFPSPRDLATFTTSGLVPSSPGVIDDGGTRNVFWFIHVTDTQDCWFFPERVGWFNQLLNESFHAIQPAFIVNTGDLVDTVYDNIFVAHPGQDLHEWTTYKASLEANDMNTSVYIDLPGNHDVYGDHGFTHYRSYSMLGPQFDANDNVLQWSWNVTTSQGTVAFLGLNTAENLGIEFPFEVWGQMDGPRLDWLETELVRYRDAARVIVLGHHPLHDILSSFSTSGKTVDMMLAAHGVNAYVYGHNHVNLNELYPELGDIRAIQTTKFSKEGGTYRIIVMDDFQLSSVVAMVGDWPQAVISNPAPANHLAGGRDTGVAIDSDVVRVMAWDPAGVDMVQVRAGDEGAWVNATRVGTGPAWELERDVASLRGMTVHARVHGGSGITTVSIHVDTVPSLDVGSRLIVLLAIWGTIGLAATLSIVAATLRLHVGGKYKKRKEQNVDPGMRRLFLLKCLVLAVAPLVVSPIINGAPVLVFSLFVVSTNPLAVNAYVILLLYSGLLFLGGVLPHGLLLNPRKKRPGILVAAPVSICLLCFGLSLFLVRGPASWFAPGFYALVALDVLMMRRAWQLVARG